MISIRHKKFFKPVLAVFSLLAVLMFSSNVHAEGEAHEITDVTINVSDGSDSSKIHDNSYHTCLNLAQGTTINIKSSEDIYGIYITWYNITPPAWSLTSGGSSYTFGTDKYLHEYHAIDTPSNDITLSLYDNSGIICDIFVYSQGTLPDNVQVWEPAAQKADILLLSTHSDDEHLFFGGTLPYYSRERGLDVQVVYFASFWETEPIREHEKLDGLWTAGVTHYPDCGGFYDNYSDSLAQAQQQYGEDAVTSFVVNMIRKYKPQVLLGQDLNGEYGHGAHMLTADAITKAILVSNDPNSYPDSANAYGTFDVPKTYLHLYPENKIALNWRQPLTTFNNQTGLEVAAAAYKMHVSQQYCWFYVSDDYEYSCADFGMVRSLVGDDVNKNDFFENLTSYKDQEEILRQKLSSDGRNIIKTALTQDMDMTDMKVKHSLFSFDFSIKTILFIVLGILILFMIYIVFAVVVRMQKVNKRKHKRHK